MTPANLVSTALEPCALAAQVEAHDTRIQAEVVQPWRYGVCDLCGYLECAGDAWVDWYSPVDHRNHVACLSRAHLDAWVTGFLLSDLGDPERYPEPVLVKIGGAAC